MTTVMTVLDTGTLLTGIVIFCARVADVSLGTIRTISIVHGRMKEAFVLGFAEVTIWLVVISTVVQRIASEPLLGIFYALGFSTGSVAGILLEKRLAAGHAVLRIVTVEKGLLMADVIRERGFGVTTFSGEGKFGPVTELYVVCRRKDLWQLITLVREIEPEAFYITEYAGSVSKILRPVSQSPTGWRAILKRK